MKPMPALIAMTAVALAACGQFGGNAVVPTPISPPTGALTAWASFPADQKPRPIVWLRNPSPANGYASGEAKLSAYCNKYALGFVLPTTVPDRAIATWPDGTSATYRGISAPAAFARLIADTTQYQDPQCSSYGSLVISGARLGTFDFVTDRGRALMTAWLFSATGVNGDLAYPAMLPTAFWTGGMLAQYANGTTVISADGRSLTYTFYGAPSDPGPCGADYKGVIAESQTAVAIALQEVSHASSGQMVACPAVAEQRSVVVALALPLGGRVVVDGSSQATSVCPETKPDC